MKASMKTRLLTPSDLALLPPPYYLVPGLLRGGGDSLTYGPSGAGKTFLAIDVSLCVATDTPFFGKAVEPGGVVYIASEGAPGILPRIEAWCQARGVKQVDNFRVWPEPVNFYSGDTAEFVAAVDGLATTPSLIVVDTVARCMVGGDENSARDTGLFISNIGELRARFGCATWSIHHTGKNGELERGSSALRGAADTITSLKPDGAGLKLTCEKQKDSEPFEPWRLHLQPVGESVSLALGTVSGRLAPQETQILETVSASFGTDWVSTSKVREVAGVAPSSLYRGLKALVQAGKLDERPVGKQRREYRVSPAAEQPSQTFPNRPTGPAQNQPTQTPSLRDGVVDGEAVRLVTVNEGVAV